MVTNARADVLEQLREAILSGRIRPGDRLPGERQLCESFGVGRPTLREALRSLEAIGMIEVRPGKGGGSYAVTPSESTVGDALSALLSLRGASPEDLAEFRVDFEGENAAWAARCADAADISALQAIVAEAGAVAEDAAGRSRLARIDVRWHEALARATKNRLRIGIALGIHDPRRHRRYHRGDRRRRRRDGAPADARPHRGLEPPHDRLAVMVLPLVGIRPFEEPH